jgi:AraC family transcriptional regulator
MHASPLPRHLPHGRFLGETCRRAAVPGFELAHLRATVPCAEVAEHTHPEAHFVLVISGDYLTSARSPQPARRGPLLIYNPPGTTHRDRFAGDGRFFTVAVAASVLEHLPPRSRALPERAVTLDGAALLLARRLADVTGRDEATPSPVIEELATALLDAASGTPGPGERAVPRWLERVRERLSSEPRAVHPLADLAREAGVHPFHLTRAFRQHFGITPGAVARRRRLGRAADRLARTRAALAEIALECGFYDQAHFSRAFRAAFGETPRAYRLRRS